MNRNQELFETMPVPRAVRTMVVPCIISQLIILIYSMADTFFIGRTNDPRMVAAASIVLPIFNICGSIAAVAGVGGGSLVSRLLGEKREEEAERVYSFGVWFSVCAAALFSVIVFVGMEPLLLLLGAGNEIKDFARSYAMCVIVAGAVPTVMSQVLSNYVRSIGESGKAGFGITMGGIINMFLDPLFMFVILPRGNEILGAGIATCISNVISTVYFICIIRRLRKTTVLRLGSPRVLPRRDSIVKLFTVGFPSAVAGLLFDLNFIVIDRLMSSYSDIALAAIGIVLKAERLPLNVGGGICQGMVPIVAYNFASGNYKRMHEVSNYSLKLGIIISIISIALNEACAPYIMRFFINDPETVELGTRFLRARSLATVFMFMSFYHVHLFNGYVRGREALLLGCMRWLVFNIPMLFLMNHLFGMYGIVWSQLIADIMNVTFSILFHRKFLRDNGIIQ